MPDQKFLVSDVGGTNIRLAWFHGNPRERQDEVNYRTDPRTDKPYEILPTLREYCHKVNQRFAAACLGVAGHVEGDHVQFTNRPDFIRRKDIAAVLCVDDSKILLINDMPPHLAGVDLLLPSELTDIRTGKTDRTGSRAVLMPGTGVGVGGAVTVPGFLHRPFPSEGGHIDFAPRDEQQDRLLKFLRPFAVAADDNYVSNEFIFAGEGLRRIYTFLQNPDATNFDAAPKSEDITNAVATGNLSPDDLRFRTVDLFLKILGAAAGNLALLFTATGGIYLGGSICLSLQKYLSSPMFIDAFLNSGPQTHRALLEEVPVHLIDYKDSGLLGCGVLARQLIN